MHPIPVFYVPEMAARDAESFSPSAGKPAAVVSDWRGNFDIAPEVEFVEFDSISRDVIALAHDPVYVADVLALRRPNGFSTFCPGVAASLPFTSGSLLAAARHVLAEPDDWGARSRVACSPSSGFHHAHFDHAHGYCTFNGLMVAALALKAEGLVDRVLILDCDEHFGDGTQDIVERLGIDWVAHVTHRGSLPGGYRGRDDMLHQIERHLVAFGNPAGGRGVALYQAGADCHVLDPLGGFLTTEEMRRRDDLVFTLAQRHRVPLAWNLAGGYQRDKRNGIEPVLALHRQTMVAAIEAQVRATRAARVSPSSAALPCRGAS